MDKLLGIKHWQLLVLIFLPTIIVELLYPDTLNFLNVLGSIWCFTIYVFWLYSIGNKVSKNNSVSVLQTRLFKVSFYYIIFYLLLLIGLYNRNDADFPSWQIPVHVLALFASFYLLYFAAKSLIEIEKANRTAGSDFFSTFIAFWIFPIGVFFVQPRINKTLT